MFPIIDHFSFLKQLADHRGLIVKFVLPANFSLGLFPRCETLRRGLCGSHFLRVLFSFHTKTSSGLHGCAGLK